MNKRQKEQAKRNSDKMRNVKGESMETIRRDAAYDLAMIREINRDRKANA